MTKNEDMLSLQKNRVFVHNQAFQLVFAALCVSMGLVLPSFFHLIGGAGPAFLPMHIPALLCGFVCSWRYGLLCGMVMPFISSMITGMPVLFPTAIAMCFELATYGAVASLAYKKLGVYPALILAMLSGRCVAGVANFFLLGLKGAPYGLETFVSASFVVAVPGIILQLLLLPILVKVIEKAVVYLEK